jgi:hypothetical protein
MNYHFLAHNDSEHILKAIKKSGSTGNIVGGFVSFV